MGVVPTRQSPLANWPDAELTVMELNASNEPAARPCTLMVIDEAEFVRVHEEALKLANELPVAVTEIESEAELGVPERDRTAVDTAPTARCVGSVCARHRSGTMLNVNDRVVRLHEDAPAPLSVSVSVPPVDEAEGVNGTCTVVADEFAGNVTGGIDSPGTSNANVTTMAPSLEVEFAPIDNGMFVVLPAGMTVVAGLNVSWRGRSGSTSKETVFSGTNAELEELTESTRPLAALTPLTEVVAV